MAGAEPEYSPGSAALPTLWARLPASGHKTSPGKPPSSCQSNSRNVTEFKATVLGEVPHLLSHSPPADPVWREPGRGGRVTCCSAAALSPARHLAHSAVTHRPSLLSLLHPQPRHLLALLSPSQHQAPIASQMQCCTPPVPSRGYGISSVPSFFGSLLSWYGGS